MAGRATCSLPCSLLISFSLSYFRLTILTASIPVMMGMFMSISSTATGYTAYVSAVSALFRVSSKKSQASWPFESVTS